MAKEKKMKSETKVDDRQVRQQAFIKEMEALEDKYNLQVGVKLVYAEAGIVPRIILTDKTKDAKTDEQPAN